MVNTIQVGRLTLREDLTASETSDTQGKRQLTLSGQESVPRLSRAAVESQRSDLLGMPGTVVPVTFTQKAALSGFYVMEDVSGTLEDHGSDLVVWRWSLTLSRLGTSGEVDIESRLGGPLTRANAFAATGERSHAPAGGASAYWSGTSAASAVDRPCADGGSIRVYRTLAATVHPRWVSTTTGYPVGRVRFIDSTTKERAGTVQSLATTGWQLHNGIMRVKPGTGTTFDIGVWDTGAWADTAYNVDTESPYASITTWDQLSLLRNDYEAVTLRLLKSLTAVGRFTLDVTLRRGSRVAELYLQNEFSTQMRVIRAVAAAGTQTSGYVTANANDAAGNRYVVGSALAYSANTATGGVEKTATTTLDAMVGCVLDGSGALAGDTAAVLYAQYLGMPSEVVRGVRR